MGRLVEITESEMKGQEHDNVQKKECEMKSGPRETKYRWKQPKEAADEIVLFGDQLQCINAQSYETKTRKARGQEYIPR